MERSDGHTLTLADLYLEFNFQVQTEITRLAQALEDCKEVEAVVSGTVNVGTNCIKSRLVEFKACLASPVASLTYTKTFKNGFRVTAE